MGRWKMPEDQKLKQVPIRMLPGEWDDVKEAAEAEGVSAATYALAQLRFALSMTVEERELISLLREKAKLEVVEKRVQDRLNGLLNSAA